MSGQLVGREEELQALELFLATTRRDPRALVIEGEAGVGKTSLWEAAIHTAADGGARCLSARPAEAEASFAYAALGDLLRGERETLATLPLRQRHAVEVALLLSDDGGEAPDAQSVGLGVLGVVERLAADGPLVLAVDDVQWLDTPSAAVLSFAARRVSEVPVALLLSWRTAGGGAGPRALAAAAALTQPTLALVGAVSGGGRDALDEAERAEVISVRDGRIRFAHPLLASSAYAGIDASARRELHASAADHVHDPEERARHLALAASGPDESVAAALEEGAGRAESRGAPQAAAELYERAAALTPADGAEDRLRRTRQAAFCMFQSGDGRRAREQLDAVVGELGPGPERAAALISLARVRSYDDDLRAAEGLFRQALEEAGDDNELRSAAGENVAAFLFRLRERLEEAVQYAAAAARAAEAAGHTGWLAEALGGRIIAEGALGRRESTARTIEAALALQPECESRRPLAQPLFQVGVVWLWWDQLDEAKSAFERLSARSREMGDESSLPYVLVLAAQVEAVRGDLPLAAAYANEGYELAEQVGQETLCAYLPALRAVVHADAGEPEACRAAAGRALELAERTSGRPADHFATAALGRLELSLGRPAEAEAVLGPLVEFLRREQIREPGTARVVPDRIEALVALGRLDEAEELLG